MIEKHGEHVQQSHEKVGRAWEHAEEKIKNPAYELADPAILADSKKLADHLILVEQIIPLVRLNRKYRSLSDKQQKLFKSFLPDERDELDKLKRTILKKDGRPRKNATEKDIHRLEELSAKDRAIRVLELEIRQISGQIDELRPPPGYINYNYMNYRYLQHASVGGPHWIEKGPVNPLLWFGLFGNAGIQEFPGEHDVVMVAAAKLAIAHDYSGIVEYIDQTITGRHEPYNSGKHFMRDKFCHEYLNEKLDSPGGCDILRQALNTVKPYLGNPPPREKKWSRPVTKSEIVTILHVGSVHKLNVFIEQGVYEVVPVGTNRQSWRIRIDTLSEDLQKKFT
jgi:hypothetical protein